MMSSQDPVQYEFPAFEANFTPDEIDQLLSLFESEPPVHSTSSSETTRSVYPMDERKRRRMLSNRESARRSRWRKKRHLEDVADQLNRLKLENRELKNHLCVVTHEYHAAQRETNRLIVESIDLQQKLSGLYQVLCSMQF
ncbi:unnamed protein product [Ilex paraguariensis]|uniref:BZIP domain-containing protein n=1 Tax=Ilex paraguariensis TaxID=185542 RepID=A0ABC8RFL7_9AQUA